MSETATTTRPEKTAPPIPNEFVCPITLEMMLHPVRCNGDATKQAYEREAIEMWFFTETHDSLPTSNVIIQDKTLLDAEDILKQIREYIEKNPEAQDQMYSLRNTIRDLATIIRKQNGNQMIQIFYNEPRLLLKAAPLNPSLTSFPSSLAGLYSFFHLACDEGNAGIVWALLRLYKKFNKFYVVRAFPRVQSWRPKHLHNGLQLAFNKETINVGELLQLSHLISDVNKAHFAYDKVPLLTGSTVLCLAAFSGACEHIAFMVNKLEADVNCCSSIGIPPLVYAIENKHKDAVKLLLDLGANVNQTFNWIVLDNEGRRITFTDMTPLLYALMKCTAPAIPIMLLKHIEADPKHLCTITVEQTYRLNGLNTAHFVVSRFCAIVDKGALIEHLQRNGVDFNHKITIEYGTELENGLKNVSPLFHGILFDISEDLAEKLVQAGTAVETTTTGKYFIGESQIDVVDAPLLHFLCLKHREDLIDLLKDNNLLDPNILDGDGRTCLHYVFLLPTIPRPTKEFIFSLLLELKVDPTVSDKHGKTAMDYAHAQGFKEMVQEIMSYFS